LGVALDARGEGLGERLLGAAILAARSMRREVGCIGILVDAKPVAVGFYERFGFRVIEPPATASDTEKMYLPFDIIESG
jgi:GNAT superfamily N-acetyltransferase